MIKLHANLKVVRVMARIVNQEAVKRAAVRSTRASAKLEHRTVPKGFVRSEHVERFLAKRRRRD